MRRPCADRERSDAQLPASRVAFAKAQSALAEIYDSWFSDQGGVGLQTLRDWVVPFNARGPDGKASREAPAS